MVKLPFLDYNLSEENVVEICEKVVAVAGLDWPLDRLVVGNANSYGMLNNVFLCRKNQDEQELAFVVKTYNQYFCSPLEDRLVVSQFLHSQGLGAKHLALLRNGVAMLYIPGFIFPTRVDQRLYDGKYWSAIAATLASWHQRKVLTAAQNAGVKMVHSLGGSATSHWDRALQQPLMANDRHRFPTEEQFIKEEEQVREQLLQQGALELAFTHMDANPTNVLIQKNGEALLIDYDFSGLGYSQLDLGWYFLTFMDLNDPDPRTNPDQEYERNFIGVYLEARKALEPELELPSLDEYYGQVQKAKALVWLRLTTSGPIIIDYKANPMFLEYSKVCRDLFVQTKTQYGLA